MRNTVRWVAAAAATITIAGGAVPASANDPVSRVTGTAEFRLPFAPDNDVRQFSFDVKADPFTRPLPGRPQGLPMDATGTVRVSHHVATSNVTVTFEAAVDCLITSPGYAAMTAVVTRADTPVADWVGKRVGFSVQDGGRGGHGDRAGYSWSMSADQEEDGTWVQARVGTCLAPAPFGPVTRGDFRVRHVELREDPQP
ncbi:hypothetical protein Acy02nite_06580 [Actinoplanes cyaneus]|uniref:Uncharacterized protein n=1 Tax=Actinoplanes cyaneus TaxID=52696 RepID=A0A919IE76_9ACTN|nr:hypothetical protein [Actinoplanes cyaneus]MCW2135858.1 hypothetical protein [Actinoplanes cyaneus]GID62777.1 hypothetical protein Acy02nite_06580 [Actinoplanes cyaneus]